VTQAPSSKAALQPGQVILQPGPSGMVGSTQLYSVPASVQAQPQMVQMIQPVSAVRRWLLLSASVYLYLSGSRQSELKQDPFCPGAVGRHVG
jgi:hypothetical protein